jgi:hypothetical protein
VTVVPRRVNLKAFFGKFVTAAARTWRSASIATPSSTGSTVSLMPLASASNVAAGTSSSMKPEADGTCSPEFA